MKGRRPPFWNRDAQTQFAAQRAAARKKRLAAIIPPPPVAPPDAPDPTVAPPVEITDETSAPSIIRPGFRQYQAPTLQQPPQPWLDQSDTPLPLRVSEEQDHPTTADDESRPENNPAGSASPNAETIFVSTWGLSEAAVTHIPNRLMGVEVRLVDAEDPVLGGNQFFVSSTSNQEELTNQIANILGRLEIFPSASIQQQQRPAAYRFEVHRGKIGVLPEPPKPRDREFAADTYHELVAKAQELHDRLSGSNSARRLCNSVERLLLALGSNFDELRPGVLLSRSRSIEADRAAFADELFPDALALMDDALQTLRDLLAAFPIVRRIEAEGMALDLDRIRDAIPVIREQMAAIQVAAENSGAVTEETTVALAQNDAAIEDAIDPVVRRSLVADKLLVFRNFAGAVIGGAASYGRGALAKAGAELGELGGKSWQAIKDELPNGFGTAARIAPVIGLVTLAGVIAGPVGSIASVVPAFEPISNALKNAIRDGLKDARAGKEKDKPNGKKGRTKP
jgi:hypothetical protein